MYQNQMMPLTFDYVISFILSILLILSCFIE